MTPHPEHNESVENHQLDQTRNLAEQCNTLESEIHELNRVEDAHTGRCEDRLGHKTDNIPEYNALVRDENTDLQNESDKLTGELTQFPEGYALLEAGDAAEIAGNNQKLEAEAQTQALETENPRFNETVLATHEEREEGGTQAQFTNLGTQEEAVSTIDYMVDGAGSFGDVNVAEGNNVSQSEDGFNRGGVSV